MEKVTLSKILRWPAYYLANKLKPTLTPEQDEKVFSMNHEINDKISLWCGDMTRLEIDAIVNAANSELEAGGGVCGSIHHTAGPELANECSMLGGCLPGAAKLTKGYNLPAKHVIHAVGPQGEDPEVLRSAYESSFRVMVENGIRTIAFPCISTGIYGYPNESAAHVALLQTRHFMQEQHSKVDRVIFAVYLEQDKLIYEKLMERYFPVTDWSSKL